MNAYCDLLIAGGGLSGFLSSAEAGLQARTSMSSCLKRALSARTGGPWLNAGQFLTGGHNRCTSFVGTVPQELRAARSSIRRIFCTRSAGARIPRRTIEGWPRLAGLDHTTTCAHPAAGAVNGGRE